MKIAWGNKVSEEFCRRVILLQGRLAWRPEQASHLMACMAFESDETFSPAIKNKAGSGATGLIQLMPKTAIGMGTTVEALALLDAEDQLDYVERYFRPYAKRIQTLSDMYMAILLPRYIGALDNAILFSNGIAYRQNAGLDSDKDGTITKREATSLVQAKLTRGMLPGFYREVDSQ